jgi:SAM-dependent methyltransferase
MPAMNYDRIAVLYDAYVTSDFDVDFFMKQTEQTTGEILELMSGTGRLSLPLIEAGLPLTCVDSSAAMLNILRQKLREQQLTATVIEMDVRELSLGKKFDLIFIPFHAFAEIVSHAGQRQALQKIGEHLTQNGRFICTLHNPPIRMKMIDGRENLIGKFPLERYGGALFVWSVETYNSDTKIVKGYQFYEEYNVGGRLQSKLFLDIEFYLHDRASIEQLIADTGFQVEALYGDYSGGVFRPDTSPVMIWCLSRQPKGENHNEV